MSLTLAFLASLARVDFPGRKGVRAKDAKDSKVRKRGTLSCPLIIRFGGRVGRRGAPGSVSPATTDGGAGGGTAGGGFFGGGDGGMSGGGACPLDGFVRQRLPAQ